MMNLANNHGWGAYRPQDEPTIIILPNERSIKLSSNFILLIGQCNHQASLERFLCAVTVVNAASHSWPKCRGLLSNRWTFLRLRDQCTSGGRFKSPPLTEKLQATDGFSGEAVSAPGRLTTLYRWPVLIRAGVRAFEMCQTNSLSSCFPSILFQGVSSPDRVSLSSTGWLY